MATRVRRGVALLDEKVPGWHNRIDVEKLEINDVCGCIIGQLHDMSFWHARAEQFLGLSGKAAFMAHGFDGDYYDSEEAENFEYAALTRLWRFVVRSRQSAAFFAHPDVNGDGFDLVYAVAANGDVAVWSERYGWHASKFGNLNEDSEYDRAHFADHLVPVSVEQLPVGAR